MRLRILLDRQPSPLFSGVVPFVDPSGSVALELSFAMWEDMGRPEVVTVTVEEGDTLNG